MTNSASRSSCPESCHLTLTEAALAARRLMSTPAGAALMQQLATAQQGNADAWSVGVSKVPAVVVDRRYVVYGQPDVATAMQTINRARGQ